MLKLKLFIINYTFFAAADYFNIFKIYLKKFKV